MKLNLIVANDRNGVIGNSKTNSMPWHLPPDLRRFKSITSGHPIIMGKNTHLSIGRILPGRKNIIISSNPGALGIPCNVFDGPDAEQDALGFSDMIRALLFCETWLRAEQAFVIGGGKIYQYVLQNFKVDNIYQTVIDLETDGDVFFNVDHLDDFYLESSEVGTHEGTNFTFRKYSRDL